MALVTVLGEGFICELRKKNSLGVVGMARPYGAALRSWGPGYGGDTAKRRHENGHPQFQQCQVVQRFGSRRREDFFRVFRMPLGCAAMALQAPRTSLAGAGIMASTLGVSEH